MTSEDRAAVLPAVDPVTPAATAIDPVALATALQDAVERVDGVVRVVPPLSSALRGLRRGAASPALTATVNGSVVDVVVDVVTRETATARVVAKDVVERLRSVVAANGLEPGLVTVGVLDIEPTTG